MEKLIACLHSVFPACDVGTVNSATLLEDVPGWDSMSNVNFLLELESTFSVQLMDEPVGAATSLGELLAILREKGAQV